MDNNYYISKRKKVHGRNIYCIGLKDNKIRKKHLSNYHGVTLCTSTREELRKWGAYIDIGKKRLWIGTNYLSQNEAAIAYNIFIEKNHPGIYPINKLIDDDIHNKKVVYSTFRGIGMRSTKNSLNRPTSKEECIKRILSTINDKNRHRIEWPNKIICNYLNGDKKGIMSLYQQNLSMYNYTINKFASYTLGKKVKRKRIESTKTIDDYILEGFLICMEAIDKFMFTGGSFKKWSTMVIINYAKSCFREERKKMEWKRESTFDYDKAWQEI